MNRKELDWLLGMYEMETTVEVMLKKSELTGVPFQELIVSDCDFIGNGMVGFCQMLCRNLFVPGYPNGEFLVSNRLVDVMRTREVWKDMPYPPTLMEVMEKRMPFLKQGK